jgi:hypothetical protein
MASPEGPTEAIIKLLSEELRALIVGPTRNLKNAVPEQLTFEAGILAGATPAIMYQLRCGGGSSRDERPSASQVLAMQGVGLTPMSTENVPVPFTFLRRGA